MTGLAPAIEAFHFIRPFWLLLAPVVLLFWYVVRRRASTRSSPSEGLAPHLRAALTVGADGNRWLVPIDGVALGLLLAALGAAGPTWSRVPDPFVAQTAPLVIVLKVAPSMTTEDLAPSRIERGKQKIRDLLALRAGARSALVAYAGTAHPVVPMTDDPNVIAPYLAGLSPDIMPEEGDDLAAAMGLAQALLQKEGVPGGILVVTDSVNRSDLTLFSATETASLAVLAMLPEGASDPGIDSLSVPVLKATPDDGDVRTLDRSLNAAYQRALTKDGTQPWDDRGWLLAWPAALLTLLWFRQGWTMRWVVLVLVLAGLTPSGPVRAEGIADWFLTTDQQGRLAYENKKYRRAAELFADPMWKGQALYRDGKYAEAAQVFARLDSAEAAFFQGMAHVKGREYRDGIAAFEKTLDRDPDFPGAAKNLETSKIILDYIEQTRAASDSGEETGIGADDVVMDNKDALGVETRIEGDEGDAKLLTADQWMNAVDTNTSDFLRQRFAIEAAGSK